MQLTTDLKAQLDAQKQQCTFCKLIRKDLPSKIVFEDEKTIAMLDIYPVVKGHTLFMPKEHYPILPYLPLEECAHLFGILPALAKAIKEGMVTTSINIFIANGSVAGQQAPHFLLHILPRDAGDGLFNFLFGNSQRLAEQKTQQLLQNLAAVMNDHFTRNPAPWHTGAGEKPPFLSSVYSSGTPLYEDERLLVLLSNKAVAGHLEIYSKTEASLLEKLPAEEAAYLFQVGSSAASLLFQGLDAQGTNLILKSGRTDDHPQGLLCLHVLPRKQDDSLQGLLWQPKQPGYNLDGVMEKIKDKTWKVKYKEEKKETPKTEKIRAIVKMRIPGTKKISTNADDEISVAIEKIRS